MLQASGGVIWDWFNSEATLGCTVNPRQPLVLAIGRLRQEDLCHFQIGLVLVVKDSQSCKHTHKQLATDSGSLRWECEEGAVVTIICSVPGGSTGTGHQDTGSSSTCILEQSQGPQGIDYPRYSGRNPCPVLCQVPREIIRAHKVSSPVIGYVHQVTRLFFFFLSMIEGKGHFVGRRTEIQRHSQPKVIEKRQGPGTAPFPEWVEPS